MQSPISLEKAYDIAQEIVVEEIKSEEFNKETKTHLYLVLFQELEKQGIEKSKIVFEGHRIIEDALQRKKNDTNIRFNNDSLYYRVSREAGYSDSVQVHSDNSSVFSRDLVGESVQERKQLIEFLDDLRKEILEEIGTLEMDYYLDDNGNEVKVKWQNYFDQEHKTFLPFLQNTYYQNKEEWRKMFDSRQSILPTMRIPITALVSVVMRKDLANNYYAKVRDLFKITPKKLKQYLSDLTLSGERTVEGMSQSDFFQTLNTDAWQWNFLDIPCPVCKEQRLQLRIFSKGEPKWVCTNWDYHHGDAEFPLSLYSDRIEQLETNRGGSADKYLKSKGIHVVDN